MLLAQKRLLTDGLQHVQKYGAKNASAPAPPARSNCQRSNPEDEELDGDRAHGLPLRYMSRPSVQSPISWPGVCSRHD